jgi:hypothetical protein
MSSEKEWRSTKGRSKPGWSLAECRGLADAWSVEMPPSVAMLLRAGSLQGPVIALPELTTPNLRDLSKHMMWLKPTVMLYPLSAPSTYLIADALLLYDKEWWNRKGISHTGAEGHILETHAYRQTHRRADMHTTTRP